MDHLRLIALVAWVAACGDAGAQPTASSPGGIKPPAGWQPQPAIATAAKDALGKVTIDGIEAFGDPAAGCYALWMALRGSGTAKELGEQIIRGLTEEPPKSKTPTPARKIAIKDVVKPTADAGVLSLTFESAPYKGRLRARLAKDRITALACFSSPREPVACDAACTAVLSNLP